MPESLFLQNCRPTRKEILAHVFSYKIFEIFKSIFFKKDLGTTDSGFEVFSTIFTHISGTFRTFRERFIFKKISLFFLLVLGFRKPGSQDMLISLVTGRNSDYMDKVFMQA